MTARAEPGSAPVLIVHGIWDSRARMAALERGLVARGVEHARAFDLKPNDGRAPIATLAEQVKRQADALRDEHDGPIDLVGFSMGALVCRYYLQKLGGRAHVRRFVSISGPHQGTLTAYALPLPGLRDMRPGSALIRELDADATGFGAVEVHCLYTPYDLMIVPAASSILSCAKTTRRLAVPIHRMMITQRAALDAIAALLRC
jgi:triacylglycerol lipase